MWQLRRKYGPYAWSKTSQAFYGLLKQSIAPCESVLEFGSSTGHVSFRLAREGHRLTLLDIRAKPIEEAKLIFAKAGVDAHFSIGNFLEHDEPYGLLWNSGLIQCLLPEERELLLHHATRLSDRLMLFYPDTDASKKVRGEDRAQTPGVNGCMEYSVAELPEHFCRHYDKVSWGRLTARNLGLPFDMFWLKGDNTCG